MHWAGLLYLTTVQLKNTNNFQPSNYHSIQAIISSILILLKFQYAESINENKVFII